jgi:hypothetical protein
MTHESRFSSQDFGPLRGTLENAPAIMPPIEVQSPSTISLVADLYFDRGFQAGYGRAIRDELSAIVAVAERFMNSVTTTQGDRALLYAFVRQIQLRLAELPEEQSSFGDGGGI